MSPIKSYLRENLLETALCLPLPPLIPRLQIPLVYLQLWCLAGLIVQVHCASGSESTIEPGISKRTHSDDISFIILYHVIKLQKLGMRYGDRGAWADLANSFKKRNRNQTFKRAFEIETMNHWITGPGNASAVVMWKNSLKCDFGHFLSKVKEEFFNQRKSFDPTLREAVKKQARKLERCACNAVKLTDCGKTCTLTKLQTAEPEKFEVKFV